MIRKSEISKNPLPQPIEKNVVKFQCVHRTLRLHRLLTEVAK